MITSTNVLLEKMPKLVLVDHSIPTKSSKSTINAYSQTVSIGESKVALPSSQADSNTNRTVSGFMMNRPNSLSVRHHALPLQLFVRTQISDTKESVIKGVVVNGSVTSYVLESEVYVLNDDGTWRTEPLFFQQRRRYSEFQTLYQQLKKRFPAAAIPQLPSIAGNVDKSDSLILRRRRQLALWLQYVLLHGGLQMSPLTSKFIAGEAYALFNPAAQFSAVDDDDGVGSGPKSEDGAAAASTTDLVGTGGRKAEPHLALMREVAQRDVITVYRCDRSHCYCSCLLSIKGSPRLIPPLLYTIIGQHTNLFQILSCRDLSQLMPHATSASNSCRRYMSALAERGNVLRDFVAPVTTANDCAII